MAQFTENVFISEFNILPSKFPPLELPPPLLADPAEVWINKPTEEPSPMLALPLIEAA